MNTTPQSAVAGMRVLMVEDEMMVAMALEMLLETMDCTVVKAGRLDKAIQLAEAETLNGALLDINLGGETVYPAAATLERRGIPFIFMTGYDINRLGSEYSGRPVLKKPFQNDEMQRMMAETFKPAE